MNGRSKSDSPKKAKSGVTATLLLEKADKENPTVEKTWHSDGLKWCCDNVCHTLREIIAHVFEVGKGVLRVRSIRTQFSCGLKGKKASLWKACAL